MQREPLTEKIPAMLWHLREQALSFLPWLLLVVPSVISTSGPLNEPVLVLRSAQYLGRHLKAITCNSAKFDPNTPPGALFLNLEVDPSLLNDCYPPSLPGRGLRCTVGEKVYLEQRYPLQVSLGMAATRIWLVLTAIRPNLTPLVPPLSFLFVKLLAHELLLNVALARVPARVHAERVETPVLTGEGIGE